MTALRHVGIVVADLDRALAFYVDLLGFRVARDMDEHGPFLDAILAMTGARVRTVKLAGNGDAMVELLAFQHPAATPAGAARGLSTIGPTHVALTVTGLRDVYARAVAAGVSFTTEPAVSADGKALVTFCRDPDGTFLELVEMLEPTP